MKTKSRCFGFRSVTKRELAMALGVAAISLAPVLATADLPPFEGSSDDAAYGEMPHSTLGAELQTPEEVAALGSGHDDVSYPQAAAARAETREGAEVRAAYDAVPDQARPPGGEPQSSAAQER